MYVYRVEACKRVVCQFMACCRSMMLQTPTIILEETHKMNIQHTKLMPESIAFTPSPIAAAPPAWTRSTPSHAHAAAAIQIAEWCAWHVAGWQCYSSAGGPHGAARLCISIYQSVNRGAATFQGLTVNQTHTHTHSHSVHTASCQTCSHH